MHKLCCGHVPGDGGQRCSRGLRDVRRWQVLRVCGSCSRKLMLDLSSELGDIGYRADGCLGLSLCSGTYRPRRRDVHGVWSGEVQGSDGLGSMHQLRRQHVLYNRGRYIGEYLSVMPGELTVCRRIDSTEQLRVQSGVYRVQRRDV